MANGYQCPVCVCTETKQGNTRRPVNYKGIGNINFVSNRKKNSLG